MSLETSVINEFDILNAQYEDSGIWQSTIFVLRHWNVLQISIWFEHTEFEFCNQMFPTKYTWVRKPETYIWIFRTKISDFELRLFRTKFTRLLTTLKSETEIWLRNLKSNIKYFERSTRTISCTPVSTSDFSLGLMTSVIATKHNAPF